MNKYKFTIEYLKNQPSYLEFLSKIVLAYFCLLTKYKKIAKKKQKSLISKQTKIVEYVHVKMSSILIVYTDPTNNPRRRELLDTALNYLNGVKESDQLINEASSYKAFHYIAKMCYVYCSEKTELEAFIGFENIFIKALELLYTKRNTFELNKSYLKTELELRELSNSEKCAGILNCVLYSMNILAKNLLVII